MPRYAHSFTTSLPAQQARDIAVQYLQGEGFEYREENGEHLWRKGTGTMTNPQFIKVEIADDSTVRLEAWTAAVSVLPGVYTGELDPMQGAFGWGPKMALKPRVHEMERRLGAPEGGGASTTEAAGPAAGWFPDPTGRHEHRYWDGAQWTATVADGGASSTDPEGVG